LRITLVNYIDEVEKRVKKWLIAKKNLCLKILNKNIECLKEPLLNAWDKVLFFDPSINKKKNNEKNIRYSNINYWMELKKKNTRTYNYQFNKFKRYTKENTCSIQAQVRDIMMDTLDVLV
jgi:hypothetical protein